MQKIQNVRFIDHGTALVKNRSDFKLRRHSFSSSQIFKLFLAFLTIVAGIAFLVYNQFIYGSLLCTLSGAILYMFGKNIERYKKNLEATEFLNAMFASALTSGYDFCMIAKENSGDIVYLDQSFQKTFPDMLPMQKRSLGGLLKTYNAPKARASAALKAIKKGSSSQLGIKMEGGSSRKVTNMTYLIEPIKRPSGFYIIRGKTAAAKAAPKRRTKKA